MHIVLAHSHANTFGGGERAVLELARALRARHDVRLLLGRFDPHHTYPELAEFRHRRVARAAWPLLHVDGDAIVSNSFGANLLALRNGARTIYWAHSTRSRFLASGSRRVDLLARRAIDWLAVRRAARLVANSRFTAAVLRQLYGREPDAVVYPGVDLDLFAPSGKPGTYAVTVGRLSPEKGLERLFDVWRDLPDLPLHVVGAGQTEYVQELRARAPSGVVFRGPLAPAEVARAYAAAALAVFAPHREELGIAALEAMASGLPVVAWREGGLTETIIDGQTGYLVSDTVTFRQRVRLVLHEAERWRVMSAAARVRGESFSWQRTASDIESVCTSVAVH
jgi:glycosyltransferase involved in cell wall biosynthesis